MSAPAATYTPPADQPPPDASVSHYGGFWVRLAAHFVDSFIIMFGVFLLSFVAGIAIAVAGGSEAASILLMVLVAALTQVYHAGFVSSSRMATPGKRLCGLYVTDDDGHRLSFGRALWRNVAALLSYLTFYIGFIMAAFTPRKRALHDMLAGTVVHRQAGSSAVAVIIVVVGLFVAVAVIGIVAAVAIPAYQDFTTRAKVANVLYAMSAAKTPVAEHMMNKGAWPTAWEQLGPDADPMHRVETQNRGIVESVRLEQGGAIAATIKIMSVRGDLRLTPKKAGDAVEWTCTSSPEIRKYVSASCRQ